MHFHLPAWAYRALAAIGGFGFIFQHLIKPMISFLKSRILQNYDEPIWIIIRQPQFKPSHTSGGKQYYSDQEIPYPLEDIQRKVGRTRRLVLASLHRLEKRQKIKEVHGGWQRKEK